MSLISEGEGNKLEATQVTRKAKVLHITTREDSQVKPTSNTLVQGITTKDANTISKLEILEERSRAIKSEGCPQGFHKGALVSPVQNNHRGKWTPNCEGPFVVKKSFSRGALILTKMDGEELPFPVNSDVLKKYNA